jgi:Glycosyl transferase family 2
VTIMLANRPRTTTPDNDVVDGSVSEPDTRNSLLDAGLATISAARDGARRSLRNLFQRRGSDRRDLPRAAKIIALVPAHNEEADIARTIDGLLSQTRPIDRIVIILDNCTDGTETIVRSYKGVTVQKTVGNIDKKVGALTQGWQRWVSNYDYVLGVDGDTVLAKDALEQLRCRGDVPLHLRQQHGHQFPGPPADSGAAHGLRVLVDRHHGP